MANPSPSATHRPDPLSFNSIRVQGGAAVGQFRLSGISFGWREAGKKKGEVFSADEAESVAWLPINSKECQLRVTMTNPDVGVLRFDGFKEWDYSVISKHIKQHWKGLELGKAKYATKGWHWGEYKLEGKDFVFNVDSRCAFTLRAQDMTQVSTNGKNDLSVLVEEDPDKLAAQDQLVEVRFYVPPPKEGEESTTESLRDNLLALGGARSEAVDAVCTLTDIKVVVPSGRYDIQISKMSMKLQGKSNDFTVNYKSIIRMYLLRSSTSHMNLLITLENPLRKGNTTYPHIIVEFDERIKCALTLSLSEEEIQQLEQDNKGLQLELAKEMKGKTHDLVVRILKALTRKQVVIPGDFKSSTGQSCLRCSNKASNGHLYPLNRSMIFIPKPIIILRYEDIASIDFGRTSGSHTRLFEFVVNTKNNQTFEFSSVDRQEHAPLVKFLQKTGVVLRNANQEDGGETGKATLLGIPSDDEDDEDFEADEDEEDDEDEDDESDEEGEGAADEEEEEGSGSEKRKGGNASAERKRKRERSEEKSGKNKKHRAQ